MQGKVFGGTHTNCLYMPEYIYIWEHQLIRDCFIFRESRMRVDRGSNFHISDFPGLQLHVVI